VRGTGAVLTKEAQELLLVTGENWEDCQDHKSCLTKDGKSRGAGIISRLYRGPEAVLVLGIKRLSMASLNNKALPGAQELP
jgi:hypothetical protein